MSVLVGKVSVIPSILNFPPPPVSRERAIEDGTLRDTEEDERRIIE